jgi:hypothetical protein
MGFEGENPVTVSKEDDATDRDCHIIIIPIDFDHQEIVFIHQANTYRIDPSTAAHKHAFWSDEVLPELFEVLISGITATFLDI